jgi:hypothetical protein
MGPSFRSGFPRGAGKGRFGPGKVYLSHMETPDRDAMRGQIERALRSLAPGDYLKPPSADEFEPFLIRKGPAGADVLYYCDEEIVSVEFAGVGTHWDYNPSEEEAASGGEDDGEAEPPDPADIVKGVVRTTVDIATEKVFAAEYRKLHAKVAKLHPVGAFEGLKAMPGFRGRSWKGTYDWPARGAGA